MKTFCLLAEIHCIDVVPSEVGEAAAQVTVEPSKTTPEESLPQDISLNDDKGAPQSNTKVQTIEIENITSHSHLANKVVDT